jgi:phage terminase large subunit GpA-like protein
MATQHDQIPAMGLNMTTEVVLIQVACGRCGREIEIECESPRGFAQSRFYAVDCPHCGCRIHPQLPGDILDVWRPGEREAQSD